MAMVCTILSPSAAHAGTSDFYTPPAELPEAPAGTILRSKPIVAVAPARARLIMYLSRDIHDKPIAVTGMMLTPLVPWLGKGPRPLVSFAEGTQGMGEACAPSRTLSSPVLVRDGGVGVGYELPMINALLTAGMAVVVTDYPGLGIPGATHAYGQNPALGNAVIDAARAAQRLSGSGVPTNGPVGFFGYSEGGGATAAAASRVTRYAPELDVVGTFSGDGLNPERSAFNHAERSLATGAMGYYLLGLMDSFPETQPVILRELNSAGRSMLAGVRHQCLIPQTALAYGRADTRTWTVSGKTIGDLLEADPTIRAAVERTRVDTRAPADPVLVTLGDNDDIVGPEATRRLVEQWCAGGATLELRESPLPMLAKGTAAGHIINNGYFGLPAIAWLTDRFNGKAARGTCT